jgi:CheY-like chemotaxis protein
LVGDKNMGEHVFISYKHEDGDFAENLSNRVGNEGFKTWVDDNRLHAGEDWRAEIDQAIKNAYALIVIMTPEAKSSEYVTYEWSFAWGAGVKIIPVILKQTSLHPRLEALQHLDFSNFANRPWNKLINVLKEAEHTESSSATPLKNITLSQIMEAASLLVAAATQTQNEAQDNEQISNMKNTEETAERINQLVTPKASQQLNRASVLWVDDIPTNNTYQRQALEALGIRFTISTSTDDALNKLQLKQYDVIISDMGRPPDPRAGYTLLEKLKEMNINTPFIIYAAGKRPEHDAEARKRGAIGTTSDPQELFELVVNAIKNA